MQIRDMQREDCIELLTRVRLGRLAYVQQNRPFITPSFFAYEEDYLYGFATVGQKIASMRANPAVCVEVEEISTPQDWATVLVSGEYEELPRDSEHATCRERAYQLLQTRPVWWEPGYVKTVLNGVERPIESVYFRIHIESVSGHRGIPETIGAI